MKKLCAIIGLIALALYFYDDAALKPSIQPPISEASEIEIEQPQDNLADAKLVMDHKSKPATLTEPIFQRIKIDLKDLESEGGESSFSQSYKLVAKGLKFSEDEMTYMIEFDHALSGALSVIIVGDQGETELSSSSLQFDSDSKKLFRGDWIKSDLENSSLQQIALTAKSHRGQSSSLSLYVQVLGDME